MSAHLRASNVQAVLGQCWAGAQSDHSQSELLLSRPSVIPPLLMGDIMCSDLPFLNRWCDANNSLPILLCQLMQTKASNSSPPVLHSQPSYRPTSSPSIPLQRRGLSREGLEGESLSALMLSSHTLAIHLILKPIFFITLYLIMSFIVLDLGFINWFTNGEQILSINDFFVIHLKLY